MPRILSLLVLSVVCALLSAPSYARSATRTPASTAHAITPSDAQLDSKIRAKLAKSKIGKDGFRFHVLHGVVTWEGSTNVVQHKGSATRMARTAGALQVVNNIQVSSAAKAGASANLKHASLVQ